jgi:hypothetical protein
MADNAPWSQPSMFLLLRGPHGKSRRMGLYVQGIEDLWTAVLVDTDAPLGAPGVLYAACFFRRTPDDTTRMGLSFDGRVRAGN